MGRQIPKILRWWPLAGIVVVFLLPMIIAGLMRQNVDQLEINTTQYGQFIEPAVSITLDQRLSEKGKIAGSSARKIRWQLIQIEPEHCDAQCVQNKKILGNMYKALGRDQVFIEIYSIQPQALQLDNATIAAMPLKAYQLLLVNDQNLAVLIYPPDSDLHRVFKDVRKLVKNSRIG